MSTAEEPRRQTLDWLVTTPETTDRTAQEGSPRSYVPSAITTSTFTDANVGAASVGQFVIAEDGDARGQVRQIKSQAATVATLDAAFNSVTGVTRLRAWRPAWRPFRSTGNGSTTTGVSTDHSALTNEPDAFLQKRGYYYAGIGGGNAGKASAVTNFTKATGTVTFSPALTSTVTGDVGELIKPLYPEGPVRATLNPNFVKRRILGYGGAQQAVKGNYAGSIGFDLAQRGLAAIAAADAAVDPPVEISDLLTDIFTATYDKPSIVGAGGAAGANCDAAAGKGGNFSVGGAVLFANGEAGQIRSIATDTLTFGTNHTTAATIAVSSVMQAAAWFKRRTVGFLPRAFHYFRGGLFRQTFSGCAPKLTTKIGRDNMVMFGFDYDVGDAFEYNLTRWVAVEAAFPMNFPDTAIASDGKGARTLIGGTALKIDNLEIDWGFVPVPRLSEMGVNQRDAHMMDTKPVTIKGTVLADQDDISGFMAFVDKLQNRTPLDFLYQKGSAIKETFLICAPSIVLTKAMANYKTGQGHYDFEAECMVPQAVPGNSFNAVLPDAVMAFI
jgi:hypothetical protein